jgi:hypothetical protein
MKFKPTLIASSIAVLMAQGAGAVTTEQSQMTNLAQTGVTAAWAQGFTGKGSIIAVIDSGFDLSNTDIKGKVLASKTFNATVLANEKTNIYSFNTKVVQAGSDVTWSLHGTEMAVVAAGSLNGTGGVGVAPDAKLLLAQVGQGVVYSNGAWVNSDTGMSLSGINSALTWAEQNKATVANLSLGSTYDNTFIGKVTAMAGSPGVYVAPSNYGSMYGYTKTDLMNFAGASKSMVIVAAAGNQGLAYSAFPGAFATQVDASGNLLLGGRMLIVGSVDNKNVISSFSNQAGSLCTTVKNGTCADPYQVKDFYVVAPGNMQVTSLPSQVSGGVTAGANTTAYVTGTSPAAAYVSGGIAVLKQAWPQLTAAQLVQLVKVTATDLGKPGVDEVYGYGLVNFDKATQPLGNLKVANFAVKQGIVTAGAYATNSTAMTTNGSISIKTSSVLQNVQAIDSINRNYTVDMTRAQSGYRVATYQYSSAWLALSPIGYHEAAFPLGQDKIVKMMQTANGVATEIETFKKDYSWSLQIGSMQEANGFLGNQGSGLMNMGSSNTTFAALGINTNIAEDVKLTAQYGIGLTRANNVSDSMLQVNGQIVSQTMKLGLAKDKIFMKGGFYKDQATVSLVSPVTVMNGRANATAVTGYNHTENEDGSVTSNPVITTQAFNMRPNVMPLDLVFGYNILDKQGGKLAVNFAHQMNVGGVGSASANGIGISYFKAF